VRLLLNWHTWCHLWCSDYPDAVFKKAFLLENRLELWHNHAIRVAYFHCAHYYVSVRPQTRPELILCLHQKLAEFQGQLLTLLEEDLLVHVFLSKDVLRVSLFVKVRTLVIQTIRSFEEKPTVFSTAVRCVE
jgi:hypothetical protein